MYEFTGVFFITRYLNGKHISADQYSGLEELVTVCAMCNDSSVDYNEVSYIIQLTCTENVRL